jgi:hypothetical protein
MKNLYLTILSLVLLISCQKEEPVPVQEESQGINYHYAYFKGTVHDSLTGAPITGYTIQFNGPGDSQDTLADGVFNPLEVFWWNAHYSYPKPTTVQVVLLDSSGWVDVISFDGNLLVEDDTVTVNLLWNQ